MKNSLRIAPILIIGVSLIVSLSSNAEDQNRNWSSSYDYFRKHFKSLSPPEGVYCESLLKEILNDLDTKDHCDGDDDCILINQEPFGDTVPFPRRLSEEMKNRMKGYCDSCDNGSFHSAENKDLIHRPVCHNGKCMVSTSFK
jgi:hypothetical protein